MVFLPHRALFIVTTIALAVSTLIVFPVSVFAQSAPATDLVTPENTISPIQSAIVAPITIEKLEDDGRVFNDFVMGPGKVELSLAPGETKTIELSVTNRMGQPETFSLNIEDAAGGRTGDRPVILLGEDRGPYTLKDYIKLPIDRFELQNMERARIPVKVSLPADAEPGGRYGSVLVSIVSQEASRPEEAGAAPSSAIVSRIGTLFFVTTPGDVMTEGALTSFDTLTHKKFFLSGPIEFALLYENTGVIHLNPYGEISISNMFGEEVGFVELDPWFVLPQSIRTREVSWTREFLLGRYIATAHINRGYDDKIDEFSVVFWVFPWKLFVAVFGALIVLYLLVKLFFSQFEFKRKE